MNLNNFTGSVVPFLADGTFGDFIESKIGEGSAETVKLVVGLVLGFITLGLFIWSGFAFVKQGTESNLTKKKVKRKHAISILISAIILLLVSTIIPNTFLEFPVGDLLPAKTAVIWDTLPSNNEIINLQIPPNTAVIWDTLPSIL